MSQAVEKVVLKNIDIINYREVLTDKIQYFTLYPVFVLIMSLLITLSK